MADRESVECSVCNRILWIEDGPICQDCLGKPIPVIEEVPPEATPVVVLSEPEGAPTLEVVSEAPPEAPSERWIDDAAEGPMSDPEAAN
mgnify:CR=1 FL=1